MIGTKRTPVSNDLKNVEFNEKKEDETMVFPKERCRPTERTKVDHLSYSSLVHLKTISSPLTFTGTSAEKIQRKAT